MSQANVFTPAKAIQKDSRITRSNVLVALSTLALVVVGALTVRLAAGGLALTTRERAIRAETDRWTGLAEYYAGLDAAVERALEADTGRWSGLAEHYAELAAVRERAVEAEAARWTGMAGYYEAQATQRQRALAADAARWTALAEWYSGQPAGADPALTAYAAHYTGLALAEYARTGDASLLPNCLSPELAARLPAIGDNSWRAEVGPCGE